MRHLGSRASAYVDGRLRGRSLRAVEAHLVGCAGCRELVEAERDLAARLRALGGTEVPAGLAERIEPPPACGGALRRFGLRVADRASLPAWRHRLAVRAAVGGGAVVLAVGSVVALGAAQEATLDGGSLLASPAALGVTTSRFQPAGEVLPAGSWVFPEGLPDDVSVVAATVREADGRDVLEMDIVGPGGSARMIQVRGRVPSDSVPDGAVVVQSGDVGVVVTGDAVVRDMVIAHLPAHGLDASPVGRWERGLEVLVSFVREVVR